MKNTTDRNNVKPKVFFIKHLVDLRLIILFNGDNDQHVLKKIKI